MKPRYLHVLIEVPADVPIAEAREFITSELRAAGGSRRTDDPLFYGLKAVKIRSVKL